MRRGGSFCPSVECDLRSLLELGRTSVALVGIEPWDGLRVSRCSGQVLSKLVRGESDNCWPLWSTRVVDGTLGLLINTELEIERL
jgi:hypothetical protein